MLQQFWTLQIVSPPNTLQHDNLPAHLHLIHLVCHIMYELFLLTCNRTYLNNNGTNSSPWFNKITRSVSQISDTFSSCQNILSSQKQSFIHKFKGSFKTSTSVPSFRMVLIYISDKAAYTCFLVGWRSSGLRSRWHNSASSLLTIVVGIGVLCCIPPQFMNTITQLHKLIYHKLG